MTACTLVRYLFRVGDGSVPRVNLFYREGDGKLRNLSTLHREGDDLMEIVTECFVYY